MRLTREYGRVGIFVLLVLALMASCTHTRVSSAQAATAAVATPAPPAAPAGMVTPAQWLKAQTPPDFARGYKLPPLTRWGWSMSYDTAKELADRWGYALEFAGYVSEAVADDALAKPEGYNGKILALMTANPKRYQLGVLIARDFPKEMPPEAYLRDAQGEFILDKNKNKILSPEMPESVLQASAKLHAAGLIKLHTRCPLAILQNGGEYGLNVLGFVQQYFEQDPKVVAAKGNLSWYDYLSRQKAREQKILGDACRAAAPDRLLYVYYTCGGNTHRRGPSAGYSFGWGWDYRDMRTVSDTATNEFYYHDFYSGWLG